MKNKHKHKNRNHHFSQPSTPSPNPIQPTPPSAPTSPAASSHDEDLSAAPATTLLALFQAAFASQIPTLDPLASSTRALLEQYAFLQQAALSERVSNLLTAEGPDSPLAMKLMRLLLSCLTNQERTSSRRSRERAARLREARQKAKDAKNVLRDQQRETHQQRLEEQAQRELNLLHAGLENDRIETASKDANSATDSATSCQTHSPQDATSPSHSRDFAPVCTNTPDSDRYAAAFNGAIPTMSA